jgi:hypothetical protein
VLQQAFKHLKSESPIVCTEVMNFSLYTYPSFPILEKYWKSLNELQEKFGGDPHVGMKLGAYLKDAGFENIRTFPLPSHLDKTDPKHKKEFLVYWKSLFASAFPEMRKANVCAEEEFQEVLKCFDVLLEKDDSILYYSPMRAVAFKR